MRPWRQTNADDDCPNTKFLRYRQSPSDPRGWCRASSDYSWLPFRCAVGWSSWFYVKLKVRKFPTISEMKRPWLTQSLLHSIHYDVSPNAFFLCSDWFETTAQHRQRVPFKSSLASNMISICTWVDVALFNILLKMTPIDYSWWNLDELDWLRRLLTDLKLFSLCDFCLFQMNWFGNKLLLTIAKVYKQMS